jgi:hypothetical protein
VFVVGGDFIDRGPGAEGFIVHQERTHIVAFDAGSGRVSFIQQDIPFHSGPKGFAPALASR